MKDLRYFLMCVMVVVFAACSTESDNYILDNVKIESEKSEGGKSEESEDSVNEEEQFLDLVLFDVRDGDTYFMTRDGWKIFVVNGEIGEKPVSLSTLDMVNYGCPKDKQELINVEGNVYVTQNIFSKCKYYKDVRVIGGVIKGMKKTDGTYSEIHEATLECNVDLGKSSEVVMMYTLKNVAIDKYKWYDRVIAPVIKFQKFVDTGEQVDYWSGKEEAGSEIGINDWSGIEGGVNI